MPLHQLLSFLCMSSLPQVFVIVMEIIHSSCSYRVRKDGGSQKAGTQCVAYIPHTVLTGWDTSETISIHRSLLASTGGMAKAAMVQGSLAEALTGFLRKGTAWSSFPWDLLGVHYWRPHSGEDLSGTTTNLHVLFLFVCF